jgi:hypothetical protein
MPAPIKRIDPALVVASYTRNGLDGSVHPLVALCIGFKPNAPRAGWSEAEQLRLLGLGVGYFAAFNRGWEGRTTEGELAAARARPVAVQTPRNMALIDAWLTRRALENAGLLARQGAN